MTTALTAKKRAATGKGLQTLRQAGAMPAIVYGPKQPAIAVEVPLKEFEKALKEAGESTVVMLALDGTDVPVLIHDVDRDPVSDMPRHADFYAIVKGQKVEVAVPIKFIGVAPAVKELNGNLVKALRELTVKADPMNLPHEFTVDVSGLDALDKPIFAKDVPLPAGVELATHEEDVVALVVAAEEEPAPEAVAAPDMSAIGISEERGKKEEEGEGAEGAA